MSVRRLIVTRTVVATCPDDRLLVPVIATALAMHGELDDRRQRRSYSFDNGAVIVTITDDFTNEYVEERS